MMKKSKDVAGKNGKSIVGILTDKAIMEKIPKTILSFDDRVEIEKSIKYVDKVISQESYSPIQNINIIQPNILMESSSHDEHDVFEMEKYMKSINGKVIVVPYYDGQSSTKIKNSIKNAYK